MKTTVDRRTQPSARDLVILVHGTYAACDVDEGDSWWQRGSQAWEELTDRLPEGAELPEEGRLFHWSGENSERARIKAARDLLDYIGELEAEGRHYHLIGHSHGGSVVWHALYRATIREQSLKGLRSWSTVGTPFLHHRTRGAWHLANIVNILVAIVLLRPAAQALFKVTQLVGSALFGLDHGISLPDDGGTGWYASARGPALKVLDFLGVPMTENAEGVRVGSFDPSGGQSFTEHVFLTPEGWLTLAVVLVSIYVYLNLAVYFVSPVVESLRIRKEKRLERNAMNAFGERWLAIWTPDDEAINGLRATLDLSVSFVAEMVPREPVLFSDRLAVIARPYRYLFAPIYNRVFRPMLDGIVRSHVIKTAQGNNRPAAEVVAVSPAPIRRKELEDLPPLPDRLSAKITEEANHHARNLAPKLRKLLAEPSFVSGLETFGAAISGRELVHTSYFDHTEVLDLLAMNIALGCWDLPHLTRIGKQQPELLEWLQDFKARMGPRAAGLLADPTIARIPPIRRREAGRRRAA